MTGNRKQNEGEGNKRPSRGIPKIPKTGLTFDGADKSTYEFIDGMQKEAEELMGIYTSIVVNGVPSPKELIEVISIANGYLANGGRRIKDNLDMVILENVITKTKVVAITKYLYAYLVMLNRCYIGNKDIFDSVDVNRILNETRQAIIGQFDTLDSMSPNEESNFKSAINGVMYDYRRLRYERHSRKNSSDNHSPIVYKDSEPIDREEDDDTYEKNIFFFETYNFAEQSFDGFMESYEEVSNGLIALLKDGELRVLSFPENGEFINTTYFTTSKNYLTHLRIQRGEFSDIKAIFMMSDGAADCLYQRKEKRLAPALKTISEWIDTNDINDVNEALQHNMQELFTKHTSDDCSLIILQNKN